MTDHMTHKLWTGKGDGGGGGGSGESDAIDVGGVIDEIAAQRTRNLGSAAAWLH